MGLFRIFCMALALPWGSPLFASPAEDAAELLARFEAAKLRTRAYEQDLLAVEGCSAEFTRSFYLYRFQLTSIDFDAWEAQQGVGIVPFDALAMRLAADWHNGLSPIPRPSPGIVFENETPEQMREITERFRAHLRDYEKDLLAGAFGEFFRRNHQISIDWDENGTFPVHFEMIGGVPMELEPALAPEFVAAMRAYVETYCRPKPASD